jgi:hypothetical protein
LRGRQLALPPFTALQVFTVYVDHGHCFLHAVGKLNGENLFQFFRWQFGYHRLDRPVNERGVRGPRFQLER